MQSTQPHTPISLSNLPPEILQQISWSAANPEFHLVCKEITSKLPPLSDFDKDLSLLLFCDRDGPDSAWGHVTPFPWTTPEATTTNYILTRETRTEFQRIVLNQPWFTYAKLKRLSHRISQQWIEIHKATTTTIPWPELQETWFQGTAFFPDRAGQTVQYCGYGEFKTEGPASAYSRVVEILYLPTKLFLTPAPACKTDFYDTILHHGGPQITSYTPATITQAIINAAIDHEEEKLESKAWFLMLLTHALTQTQTFSARALFSSVSPVIIERRKWSTLKLLCKWITIPDDFINTTLEPIVHGAITEHNDTRARDFLTWLDAEGWRNKYYLEACTSGQYLYTGRGWHAVPERYRYADLDLPIGSGGEGYIVTPPHYYSGCPHHPPPRQEKTIAV